MLDNLPAGRREQIELLRTGAGTFLSRESPLTRARSLRGQVPGFDRQFWAQLASEGWTGLLVPETHGGLGLGWHEMATVTAALADVLAPEPLVPGAVFAGRILEALAPGSALAAQLLRDLAEGSLLPAVAWQEQETGTPWTEDGDLAPPAALLEPDGAGWRLRGRKFHVRPGAGADGYLVSALLGGQPALVWVAAGAPGLTADMVQLADGTCSARLTFDNAVVAGSECLGRGDAAAAALIRALDETLIMTGVELRALAERMIGMTLDYLRTRVQFGKPIGGFQALQHRAVDMWIQLALCGAVVDEAVAALDRGAEGRERALIASRAKSRGGDAALTIAREAVQLHGAIGFTDEYDLGLYLKRALVLASWLGNPLQQRRRYAALDRAVNTNGEF